MFRAPYASMWHNAHGLRGGNKAYTRLLPITSKGYPRGSLYSLLNIELNALNAHLLKQANAVVRAVWIGIDNTSNTRLDD